MKTPPFLLGAALVFWGWETRLFIVGVLLGMVIESSRVLRSRWELSNDDIRRIWTLSSLLLVAGVIYAFIANQGTSAIGDLIENNSPANRVAAFDRSSRSVLSLFRWLPLIYFPVLVAQVFGNRDRFDLATISWLSRRRMERSLRAGTQRRDPGVNLSFPFFALVLIAASAANERSPVFFAGFTLLAAWAAMTHRSPRYSFAVWLLLLLPAIGLGYLGKGSIEVLEQKVENLRFEWIAKFFSPRFDARDARTAIGTVGRMKLSGQIMWRVETDGRPPPTLLREASYNKFQSPIWTAAHRGSPSEVIPELDGQTWMLQTALVPSNSIVVAGYLARGEGLLALPPGPVRLTQLPVGKLNQSRLGAVRVAEGPGLIRYAADWRLELPIDSVPEEQDFEVTEAEYDAVAKIASELKLGAASPQEVRQSLRALTTFFQEKFKYSTYLSIGTPADTNLTALADFLLNTRSGHCEYFATATVLLLRQAGIAARYAVGYAVSEGSNGRYVVRERHAHAWCLANVNGLWLDVDTTPASWDAVESQNASWWEPVSDFFSRLWFEFSKWRWGQSNVRPYLLWTIGILLGLMALRLFWKRSWKRSRAETGAAEAGLRLAGLDSEFYDAARLLQSRGFERRPGETLRHWLRRLESSAVPGASELLPLLPLHYGLRFDTEGLDEAKRDALRRGVRGWMERFSSTASR